MLWTDPPRVPIRLWQCMLVFVQFQTGLSLMQSVVFHPRATISCIPCLKTWFPEYLSGCFMAAVISWQYPYAGAGGLGFYLSDIEEIVQCDGLGKVMAVHVVLPDWNLTLDDGGMFPRLLLNCLLFHFVQLIFFSFFLLLLALSPFSITLCLKSALGQ